MPSLQVCMIVKNGAATLARALISLHGITDRILIGDTGSTDASVAIAQSLGAEVIAIPWEDDFAKARNRVLDVATGDWILILDADEMLDHLAAQLIPRHLAHAEAENIAAYEVWKWHYVPTLASRSEERAAEPNPGRLPEAAAYPAYTRSLSTLLFRRHFQGAAVRFEHRVHESVAGSLRRIGARVEPAEFVIHHFGFVEDSAERSAKNDLYQRLGREKLRDNPNDAHAHFELGLSELEHSKNPTEAIKHLWQTIQLRPHFAPAWIYAGICLIRLGRHTEALQMLEQALMLGANSAVLYEAMGDASFHLGRNPQALACYERADQSALVRCKRGATEVRMGQPATGLQRIESAIAEEPTSMELHNIWVAAALMAGNMQLAQRAAAHASPEYKKALSH